MEDDLPDEYDCIVLGTGFVEAIVAAALARSGHKVLHLDSNGFYGGSWATFNWKDLEQWITFSNSTSSNSEEISDERDYADLLKDGERMIRMLNPAATVTDVDVKEILQDRQEKEEGDQCQKEEDATPSLPSEREGTAENPISWDSLKEDWRRFNIDLFPKVLYCRGALVDLLISSQVSRYLEFRAVSRILTHMDENLQEVPSSRADVFNSQMVNIVEKRMLMKFLTFCMDYESQAAEYEDFRDKPFIEFLQFKKLTPKLQHFVLYALAMKRKEDTTVEALASIQKYLQSIGRYGNSPFLWPLYGTAELPQAFCRMCAVFGGIYILKKTVSRLIIDSENRFQGIVSDGKRLNAKWLIASPSYICAIEGVRVETSRKVARGIFITDKSIKPYDEEKVTLLTIPPLKSETPGVVRALELGPLSFACPKKSHVVHLTSISCESQSAKETLTKTAQVLLDCESEDSGKPHVFWRMYFSQTEMKLLEQEGNLPLNILSTIEPDDELGFQLATSKAKSIFDIVCPGEDFLPAPPDPDDVIHEPEESHNNPGTGEEKVAEEKEVPAEETKEASGNVTEN